MSLSNQVVVCFDGKIMNLINCIPGNRQIYGMCVCMYVCVRNPALQAKSLILLVGTE